MHDFYQMKMYRLLPANCSISNELTADASVVTAGTYGSYPPAVGRNIAGKSCWKRGKHNEINCADFGYETIISSCEVVLFFNVLKK